MILFLDGYILPRFSVFLFWRLSEIYLRDFKSIGIITPSECIQFHLKWGNGHAPLTRNHNLVSCQISLNDIKILYLKWKILLSQVLMLRQNKNKNRMAQKNATGYQITVSKSRRYCFVMHYRTMSIFWHWKWTDGLSIQIYYRYNCYRWMAEENNE